jgi:hypothetical protein
MEIGICGPGGWIHGFLFTALCTNCH